jgi:hypothetical protein|tara:strand:- start:424 stop:570 length:147 start_codon:yes stop_codon:yes gene_type:complete
MIKVPVASREAGENILAGTARRNKASPKHLLPSFFLKAKDTEGEIERI